MSKTNQHNRVKVPPYGNCVAPDNAAVLYSKLWTVLELPRETGGAV